MLANLVRFAGSLVAGTVANELKKPENQQKLVALAREAAAVVRHPDTSKKIENAAHSGARALGRIAGTLKNR